MKWLPKLFKYYLQRKFDPRAKQYFKNEKEDGFDSKYGTDTTKPMEIIEYGDVPIAKIKGRIRYRATHTEIIKKSIEVLPII